MITLQSKIYEIFEQMQKFPTYQWYIFDEKVERILETCPYCRKEYRKKWEEIKEYGKLAN